MINLIKFSAIFLPALLVAAAGFACGGPNRHFAVNDRQQSNAPAPEKTVEDAAQKVTTMEQQGFDFVYVFRRKDGAALDAEDRKFLRANSPPETNQWVVSDDGRTAIAGSNYAFPPAHLEALTARFAFEDRSKPKEDLPDDDVNAANVSANAKANANAVGSPRPTK
jgi:hypothetical protein